MAERLNRDLSDANRESAAAMAELDAMWARMQVPHSDQPAVARVDVTHLNSRDEDKLARRQERAKYRAMAVSNVRQVQKEVEASLKPKH
eukprot:CAMPEP_0119306492 /NCGR_PEP_ID=MMETSP1333-20130426/7241_1 /TAXON_ID=418940 /ORGANISM="Scyphosphaera apsteinii, Strain RCC1455" /LENGTH=88 /DNA_ID=CAMNT_0007309809 /DNA_START=1 /DNA_END=267 /DNA_ORIENTATION=-